MSIVNREYCLKSYTITVKKLQRHIALAHTIAIWPYSCQFYCKWWLRF